MEEPEVSPALQAAAESLDKQKAIDEESQNNLIASLQTWDDKVTEFNYLLKRNMVTPPTDEDFRRLEHCIFYFTKPKKENETISQ